MQRLAFLAVAALMWAYVILRAVLVPVVHDEAMTFFFFVEPGDFLPFLSHWDAGNHVFCTALGWSAYKLFGFHLWALRLPSVLAFVLWAAYAWKWGRHLRSPLVRWALWSALLAMPFLLEFFSLFRGYALAMALWSMALFELCAWLVQPKTRHLILTLLAMAGATYGDMSLITLWAAVLVLVAIPLLQRPWLVRPWAGRVVIWLVLGAAPLALAAVYLHELSARGALYYGLRTGIFNGTVPSLFKAMFQTDGAAGRWLVLLVLLAATWAAMRVLRAGKLSFAGWALVLSAALLWAEVIGRSALFRLNGTLYPEDRTALQWVPLFLLMAVFALDRYATQRPQARWAALLLFAFPLRTVTTANWHHTAYWPQEAIPERVFRAAAAVQAGAPRLLTIGAYHQERGCWAFGLRQHGLRLNAATVAQYPRGGEDLLLAEPGRMTLPQGYHLLERAPGNHLALYARNETFATTLLVDTLLHGTPDSIEFRQFWEPDPTSLRGRDLILQLNLALPAGLPPVTGSVVVEVGTGADRYYESLFIPFLRNPALDDSLRCALRFPVAPGADRVVIYYWDQARRPFSFSGRMRVLAVEEKTPRATVGSAQVAVQ